MMEKIGRTAFNKCLKATPNWQRVVDNSMQDFCVRALETHINDHVSRLFELEKLYTYYNIRDVKKLSYVTKSIETGVEIKRELPVGVALYKYFYCDSLFLTEVHPNGYVTFLRCAL